MAETVLNYIAGEWVASRTGRTGERRNPARTDEVVVTFPRSSVEDVDAAIAAAKGALEGWRRTPAPKRGDVLFRAQRILERRLDEMARAMTREEGKTLGESR